jgi:hypothetical protein
MNPEQFHIDTSKRLIRIESLLDNDSGTGRPGLYQEVQETKKTVESFEKRLKNVEQAQLLDKWRYSAVGGVITFLGLAGLKALGKLLGLIF